MQEAVNLAGDLASWRTEAFDTWSRACLAGLSDATVDAASTLSTASKSSQRGGLGDGRGYLAGTLTASPTRHNSAALAFDPHGRLLHLDTSCGDGGSGGTSSPGTGKLQVGFPEGLLRLSRQVRLLTSLGYRVPAQLLHTADQAEGLFRYAIVLKQVRLFFGQTLNR
ncbi:unnamed protein product [Protopolystoma xenopodis]|uniref:Uncharacterized protein n=1 Tax=Protopolystoma xenopodis TaxID=117903 RepID=A0A448WU80_9PLAT|nr:unnamed protein product [Protopolystoma xenopodis]